MEFKQWFFDLGYSVAYSVAMFAMVLIFSTSVPLILPFGTLFFGIKYLVDKYNLVYVYPMEFDYHGSIARKSIITYLVFAIFLYQLVMSSFFLVAGSLHQAMWLTMLCLSIVSFMFFLYLFNKDIF